MQNEKYDRNERLFGAQGQRKIRDTKSIVVGGGGIGTHVIQQLAYLGVGSITNIDDEEADESNRNRYITLRHKDPIPGTVKVDIAQRMVNEIDPSIVFKRIYKPLISRESFDAIKQASVVFGCVDGDGARLVLTELCTAYKVPYIDIASDVVPGPPLVYGGRIAVVWRPPGCLHCMDLLDQEEISKDLEGESDRQLREKIYGVKVSDLETKGPSVVSINGAVASLAVTEYMVAVTGLREPNKLLTYYGNTGKVTVNNAAPEHGCYYCESIYGTGDIADVYRYLKLPIRRKE